MSEKSLAKRIDEACPTRTLGVSNYGEYCTPDNPVEFCYWFGHALAQEVDEALLMARGAQKNAEGLLGLAEKRIAELEAALDGMKP